MSLENQFVTNQITNEQSIAKEPKLVKWLKDNYDQIAFIVSAILSFLASLLENYIYDCITKESDNNIINIYIKITIFIFIIAIIIGVCLLSKKIKTMLFKDGDYHKFVDKAYYETQQLSLECQAAFQEICKSDEEYNKENVLKWIANSMQRTVDRCYSFFCNSFDTGNRLIDDISFEVTFMTKSHKDHKITIPYSCNKDHRTPTSMLLRQHNPDIYDKTVTAEIYGEYEENRKPTFRLISDTEDPHGSNGNAYAFIYNNQHNRIKSSIVAPVLSHHSELLGTVVVHCNVSNFFKKKDYDFWYAIMQAFASEFGKYMLMLDYFKTKDDNLF